jgi:hypothetical protein
VLNRGIAACAGRSLPPRRRLASERETASRLAEPVLSRSVFFNQSGGGPVPEFVKGYVTKQKAIFSSTKRRCAFSAWSPARALPPPNVRNEATKKPLKITGTGAWFAGS